jgi:exodeoxyribonuclease-1
MNAEEIRLRMFTRSDELPEGVTRLPVKTVHLNKSPMVVGKLKTLSPEMAQRWGLQLDAQLANAALAQGLPDMSGIWPAVFKRPKEGPVDVDEDLYGGFVGNTDRRRLNDVRQALSQTQTAPRQAFDDPRLAELVFRYQARNFPRSLTLAQAAQWEAHRAARLFEGADGARTVDALSAEIDKLAESADERGEAILGALYDYAESIAP